MTEEGAEDVSGSNPVIVCGVDKLNVGGAAIPEGYVKFGAEFKLLY